MMLKIYPDRRWPAFLRVLADTVVFFWTVVWAYLGWLIYQTVMVVRIAAMTGRAEAARAVLAYRAVSSLSFRQLMSASPDPVGDLAEHRYDRLATAMMKRAGIDPKRLPPPDLPELPPHRER